MERPRACRPFHLFDAMILVAAAAVATYLTKVVVDFDTRWGSSRMGWSLRLGQAIEWTYPSFVAATVALVLIRLRRPRPSLRRLCRQPGFCALGAVTALLLLGSLLGLSALVVIALQGNGMEDDALRWFLGALTSSHMGMIVAAVWFVQGVSRRWRPERGWIDRSGRLLGFCWIVSLLVGWWLTFFGGLGPRATIAPLPAPPPAPFLIPPEPESSDRTEPTPVAPPLVMPPEPESSDRTDSRRPDAAP